MIVLHLRRYVGKRRRQLTVPEEGLEVIVTGRLTTFAGQSKYQIVVSQMEVLVKVHR